MHIPVLEQEVIQFLNPQPGQNFIDCTFGAGGHSKKILEKIGRGGRLIALDANADTVKIAAEQPFAGHKNFKLINTNFENLAVVVDKEFNGQKINGILFDLGLSSDELENSGRGFSFQQDEPLDMRFDTTQDLTAAAVINSYSLENLIYIFKNYSQMRGAVSLAKKIIAARKKQKILNTAQLVDLIGPKHYKQRLHPATLVFQALRIEVNNELENLKKALTQAIQLLTEQGQLVVISFHSLEDKIVKHYFKDQKKLGQIEILTKKPVTPTVKELAINPRSRSAKLRAITKN